MDYYLVGGKVQFLKLPGSVCGTRWTVCHTKPIWQEPFHWSTIPYHFSVKNWRRIFGTGVFATLRGSQ